MKFMERHRPLRRLGAFEIVEKIGQGGMCTVYRGRQASLDRPVAIKILNERPDKEARERFERESLIVARLNHPNIVHVLDRGLTPDGAPYYVMEFLEGADLAQTLAGEPLDRTRKLEIAIQVCRALAYAHKNGVIHRDIKPANILLDREGNAIVLDFGIAKVVEAAGIAGAAGPAAETRAGLVLGTLAYMAPEQMSGDHPVTAATDIYAMGVVLYELMTGQKPYGPFRRPSELDPTVPPALDEAILRCLDPDPGARFASADELRDRLLEILQGAHLDTGQRERAAGGLERIREKFALLDVIRDEPGGGVYLCQDRVERRLLVIRKRAGSAAGLAEARLLAALRHRHVAAVLGAAGDERRFIVVMEYLTGGSLRDRMIQPLPVEEVLRIGQEAAEGLAFAHRNRITHGSLRPGNLLFTESGTVKVADFGFDEHVPARPGAAAAGSAGGAVTGSIARGPDLYNPFREPRSVAADVLALGGILYQASTGAPSAWKDGALSPCSAFFRLPADVRRILAAMLASNPAARPSSCDQVAAQLRGAGAMLAEGTEGNEDFTRIERSSAGGGMHW